MDYRKLPSSSIVEKCIEKDAVAWAEFVRRSTGLMMFSIKKVLREYSPMGLDEEAKDIFQNLLMSIWANDKLAGIKVKSTIDYWLATTARNATINHVSAKKKEVLIKDTSYFENIPFNIVENRDFDEGAIQKIKYIYSSLSDRDKLLFNLYFYKEMSLKDIAKITSSPIGTVSSVITRIRNKIKCSKA